MVATSYPRFAGDTVGTFMEPIAHGVAARGHDVHLVLPWHPQLTRPLSEGGVTLPSVPLRAAPALNVFGYAGALEADVALRWSAWAAAPLALAAGVAAARRVVRAGRRDRGARPLGRPRRRDRRARRRRAGRWSSACTARTSTSPSATRSPARWRGAPSRAPGGSPPAAPTCASGRSRLGAERRAIEVVPYGVDARRFGPGAGRREPRAGPASASPRTRRSSSPPAASCGRRGSST